MRYRSVNSQTCSRETGSAFALFTKGYNSPDHCGARNPHVELDG